MIVLFYTGEHTRATYKCTMQDNKQTVDVILLDINKCQTQKDHCIGELKEYMAHGLRKVFNMEPVEELFAIIITIHT